MTAPTKVFPGRAPGGQCGEDNGNATLTAKAVCEGRRRARAGESVPAIAADLQVSETGLAQAIRGKTWGHLNHLVAPVQRPRAARRVSYTDDDRAALKWFCGDMFAAGATAPEIAWCTGVNVHTVYSWVVGRR